MINAEQLPQALKALKRLIVHAKTQAYDCADQHYVITTQNNEYQGRISRWLTR